MEEEKEKRTDESTTDTPIQASYSNSIISQNNGFENNLKEVISMERITWKELMQSLDVSHWRWSWLSDLDVVESLGDGRYLVRFNAGKIINDDPTFVTEDSENGVIVDAEGNRFEITDWKDDLTVYCEVEKTDDGIVPVDTMLHELPR